MKPAITDPRHDQPMTVAIPRAPVSYQVCVRCHLGATMLRAFPALHAETRGHDTLLRNVADQAALYGVLARIEELGLELLEVRRL